MSFSTAGAYAGADPTQLASLSAATFSQVREALAKALDQNELNKAWVQSNAATTGLTQYSLEAPAKTLYPVLTPLRNLTPRVTGGAGIQANWKAITAINTARSPVGLAEGSRGAVISTTVADYFAGFRGWGYDDYVTYEADWAAEQFDDAKARATQGLLRSVMIAEEQLLLGGLGTYGLGLTPTPTLGTATTGGAIANSTTVHIRVCALSLDGYLYAKSQNALAGQLSFTTLAGEAITQNGGTGRASTSASVATGGAGGAHVVSASVAPVKGAVGYAWFAGTASTAGNMFLVGVTTINSFVLTAMPAGTEFAITADLIATDRSQNDRVFDGLFSIAAKAGTNAYYYSMPTGTAGAGTALTADGAGGIKEVDAAFQSLWDNYRVCPTHIWVSSQEMLSFSKLVFAGGANATHRFTFNVTQNGVTMSRVIRGYLNPFSMGPGGTEVPISIHPNLPPGTILMETRELPYTLSGVTDVYRLLLRRDYYQTEWPQRTRRYEYGVYADGVLQHYFPPSLAVITNIAPS